MELDCLEDCRTHRNTVSLRSISSKWRSLLLSRNIRKRLLQPLYGEQTICVLSLKRRYVGVSVSVGVGVVVNV